MDHYYFYYPIDVRYGDLDPQGHVNNAKFLTYLEQARVAYFTKLGLWNNHSFMGMGIIIAEIRISYHHPIRLGDPIEVGLRTARIGGKSLHMEYSIEHSHTRQIFAKASSIGVAYDYAAGNSIEVPESWRTAITVFEGSLPSPAEPKTPSQSPER